MDAPKKRDSKKDLGWLTRLVEKLDAFHEACCSRFGSLHDVLIYLYLIRFPILMWTLVSALGLLAQFPGLRSLTNGVVVLEAWQQMMFAGGVSFLVCALALAQARVVAAYGEPRFAFQVPPVCRVGDTMRWKVMVAGQIPTIAFLILLTIASEPQDGDGWKMAPAGLLGALVGFVFIAVVTFVYNLLRTSGQEYHAILMPVAADPAEGDPEPSLLTSPLVYARRAPSPLAGTSSTFAQWLARYPGYGVAKTQELHSGHRLVFYLFLVLLIIFGGIGVYSRPDPHPGSGTHFPVIVAVLMLVILAGWSLSALAYWVDRFRVPVLTLVLLLAYPQVEQAALAIIFIGLLLSTLRQADRVPGWKVAGMIVAGVALVYVTPADHFYRVGSYGLERRANGKVPDPTALWLTPAEVASGWEQKHAGDPTLPMVVITAQGGGIQASAWTAKVLAELDKETGGKFRDAVVLLSGVSGGSVAVMDYANQYLLDQQAGDTRWSDKARQEVAASQQQGESKEDCRVDLAASSSLEAVAWGMVYPDTLRMLVPGLASWEWSRFADRGQTLERRWRLLRSRGPQAWCTPFVPAQSLPLSAWAGALRDGNMPAVALNATTTETGQRFLLANFSLQKQDQQSGACQPVTDLNTLRAEKEYSLTFRRLFPTCDIDVSTAARLSATFPFVAPQPRAFAHGWLDSRHGPQLLHLADGGYYDTYGISTALDFLNRVLDARSRLKAQEAPPRRKLLFIQVLCCEKPGSDAVLDDHKFRQHGGWFQLLAPMTTMMQVRSSGQWENDSRARDLLTSAALEWYDFKVIEVPFLPPNPDPDEQAATETIPLSWHLTGSERQRIGAHWENLRNRHPEGVCAILSEFAKRPWYCQAGAKSQ